MVANPQDVGVEDHAPLEDAEDVGIEDHAPLEVRPRGPAHWLLLAHRPVLDIPPPG